MKVVRARLRVAVTDDQSRLLAAGTEGTVLNRHNSHSHVEFDIVDSADEASSSWSWLWVSDNSVELIDLGDAQLAQVFIRYVQLDLPTDRWIHGVLTDRSLGIKDPEEVWPVTVAIAESTDEEAVLSRLGAGLIEDLINHHEDRFLDRVVDRARVSMQFRRALASVWPASELARARIRSVLDSGYLHGDFLDARGGTPRTDPDVMR